MYLKAVTWESDFTGGVSDLQGGGHRHWTVFPLRVVGLPLWFIQLHASHCEVKTLLVSQGLQSFMWLKVACGPYSLCPAASLPLCCAYVATPFLAEGAPFSRFQLAGRWGGRGRYSSCELNLMLLCDMGAALLGGPCGTSFRVVSLVPPFLPVPYFLLFQSSFYWSG